MKRTPFLAWIISTAISILPMSALATDLLGKQAPPFQVQSGDKESLSLNDIQGRVVFMLYETRHVTDKNRVLKDQVSEFAINELDNTELVRLPVVNASQANMITSPVWRKRFREKSKEEGITVYGDWSGEMANNYGMKPEDSNVIIIDQDGIVRYFTSGKMSQDEIDTIKSMLKTLVTDS